MSSGNSKIDIAFQKHSRRIEREIKAIEFPTTTIKAGTMVFRKIQTLRTSLTDRFGRILKDRNGDDMGSSWIPSQSDILSIPPNAASREYRWSGLRADGRSEGIGGSYWGTLHAIQAEDFAYNIKEHLAVPQSPLDPKSYPLIINDRRRLEKHLAELPTSVPVNGGSLSDIIIGTTRRDVELINVHPGNDRFQEWNVRLSHVLKEPLEEMGYRDLAEGLLDPSNRLVPRLVGNAAADCNQTGVSAPSARKRDLDWSYGFRNDLATNMTLFGRPRDNLGDLISLEALLEIRPAPAGDPIVTLRSIDEGYSTGILYDSKGEKIP